jgi:hypothetical protein
VIITLSNNLHNTQARVRAGEISRKTAARIRRALCGMSDCKCSGALGTRGPEDDINVIPTGNPDRPFLIEPK